MEIISSNYSFYIYIFIIFIVLLTISIVVVIILRKHYLMLLKKLIIACQRVIATINRKKGIKQREKTNYFHYSNQVDNIISDLEKISKSLGMPDDKKSNDFNINNLQTRIKELEEININLADNFKSKTKELQDRIMDLERFHKLTVGRELKVLELKRETVHLMKKIEELEKNK